MHLFVMFTNTFILHQLQSYLVTAADSVGTVLSCLKAAECVPSVFDTTAFVILY